MSEHSRLLERSPFNEERTASSKTEAQSNWMNFSRANIRAIRWHAVLFRGKEFSMTNKWNPSCKSGCSCTFYVTANASNSSSTFINFNSKKYIFYCFHRLSHFVNFKNGF
uniref:AB hydrolase-1 domain-containing protein n=1 Tax=Parascaris univalens TaxID=6257 RepID=A0A915A7T8_PARUN